MLYDQRQLSSRDIVVPLAGNKHHVAVFCLLPSSLVPVIDTHMHAHDTVVCAVRPQLEEHRIRAVELCEVHVRGRQLKQCRALHPDRRPPDTPGRGNLRIRPAQFARIHQEEHEQQPTRHRGNNHEPHHDRPVFSTHFLFNCHIPLRATTLSGYRADGQQRNRRLAGTLALPQSMLSCDGKRVAHRCRGFAQGYVRQGLLALPKQDAALRQKREGERTRKQPISLLPVGTIAR